MWRRNKGADLENLFQGLPISLQADITLSLYKDIIESVCLVSNYLNHENTVFFVFIIDLDNHKLNFKMKVLMVY